MFQSGSGPKARTVAFSLFVVALALAAAGALIPPASLPTSPNAVYWFWLTTWSSHSLEELVTGFATLAIFLFVLSLVVTELRQYDIGVPLGRAIRSVGLAGAVLAMAFFGAFAFADDISIGVGNPSLNPLGPLIFRSFYLAHVIDLGSAPGPFNISGIGWNATIALSLAILCMIVYRLEQGLLTAVWKSVTMFAAPAVLAFEIGLLLFGPYTMPLQATNYLIGTTFAIIFTNWFLLVVSSGLFALGLASRRHWLE